MPPKKSEKPLSTAVKGRGVSGFRSQEEKNWFEKEFKDRGVFPERPLDLPHPAIPQFKPFHDRPGWHNALGVTRLCNATLVREFCASLIPICSDDFEYEAFVRGKKIVVSPVTVASYLNVTLENVFHFPYLFKSQFYPPSKDDVVFVLTDKRFNEWPSGDNRYSTKKFSFMFQVVNLVVANCIIPTAHKADVDFDTAKLIHAIGTGLVVSLPHVMIQGIVPPTVTRGASLRCGGLITGLCIRAGVDVRASDEILKVGRPFDEVSITRSLAQFQSASKKKKRVQEAEEEYEEEEEDQHEHNRVGTSTQGQTSQNFFQAFDERMNRWDARFDRLETKFDSWDARFTQVDTRLDKLDGRLTNIESRMDNLDGRFGEFEMDINNQLGNLELTSANNFQRMHERMDGWEY